MIARWREKAARIWSDHHVRDFREIIYVFGCYLVLIAAVSLFKNLNGESFFGFYFFLEYQMLILIPVSLCAVFYVFLYVTNRDHGTFRQKFLPALDKKSYLFMLLCSLILYPVIIYSVSFKSIISFLHPYAFDSLFEHMDRVLHGGELPQDWMAPLYGHPFVIRFFDFFYAVVWFFYMYMYLAFWIVRTPGTPGRRVMIAGYAILWLVFGNILATLLSSAGPIFWEDFYPSQPDPYAAYVGALRDMPDLGLWFLKGVIMDYYSKPPVVDLNGPSAMPSMHVAMTCLIAWHSALYARRFLPFALFMVAVILVGSVLLLWHYAVDGYVGILFFLVLYAFTRKQKI